MNNVVEKFKKGNKIHIKESQKGSFTKWCGGNVTSECILKGKNSSNPKIRKKATFAANARKWKHLKGGKVSKYLKGNPINGGWLPDVKVTPTKLYLETYYPGISKYPATGHSALYGYRTKGYRYYNNYFDPNEPKLARIDKKSSDAGYNFITNNCADATRCALEAISGKKINPNFFTTPGDVLDFFKKNFDVRKSTRGGIGESLYYTNITPALLEIISKLLKALIEANRQKRQKEQLLAKKSKGGIVKAQTGVEVPNSNATEGVYKDYINYYLNLLPKILELLRLLKLMDKLLEILKSQLTSDIVLSLIGTASNYIMNNLGGLSKIFSKKSTTDNGAPSITSMYKLSNFWSNPSITNSLA